METFFGKCDVSNRVITTTDLSFAFPAQMPILPGHTLVCPKRIVEKFEELTPDEIQSLFLLVSEIKVALRKEFGATGFNIAWNEGVIAGQSEPHLHIHIVPRKPEDKGIAEYEPRKFLYRPGERAITPDEELEAVAQGLACYFSNNPGFSSELKIVTVDSPEHAVLKQPTEPIEENEFSLARKIAEKLFQALTPYLPAAGLAAPQIGISKSVFIYSFDRDPKNLEVVINPTFAPLKTSKIEGWEACFSIILSNGTWKIANISRYESIKATYFNLDGGKTTKILEGFAARAFQHEYDHLQGIQNIEREDAIVKTFDTKEELLHYLQAVKNEDAVQSKKPSNLTDEASEK